MSKESEFDFINTFPPLGHPEHHFNRIPDGNWLKDKESVYYWCKKNIKEKYQEDNDDFEDYAFLIHDDLTVTINNGERVEVLNLDEKDGLVKIRFVQNDLRIDNEKLFPYGAKNKVSFQTKTLRGRDFKYLYDLKVANLLYLAIYHKGGKDFLEKNSVLEDVLIISRLLSDGVKAISIPSNEDLFFIDSETLKDYKKTAAVKDGLIEAISKNENLNAKRKI